MITVYWELQDDSIFWAAVIIITYYEAALYSTTMKIGGWGWWVAGVSENEANAASSLP